MFECLYMNKVRGKLGVKGSELVLVLPVSKSGCKTDGNFALMKLQ